VLGPSNPASEPTVQPALNPPALNPPTHSAEDAIRAAASVVRPIGLAELNESAQLLTRVDRKYFVPADTFRLLIDELGSTFRVLQIDGQRSFDYESVYFDTPDLLTYRAHLQRRRRRFKARTRTYIDSGLCMFEVKTVDHRGNTVKELSVEVQAQAYSNVFMITGCITLAGIALAFCLRNGKPSTYATTDSEEPHAIEA
jgi:hypothetical protein